MPVKDRIPVACGIDIGSTNAKVVALDQSGAVVARASRATPRDAQHLSIDVEALFAGIENMIANVCGDAYVVHAVSAAGVGEDGVLADVDFRALTDALAWFDPRRQSLFRQLRPHLRDDALFDSETDPARTLVGWAWSSQQPITNGAVSWLSVGDYASARWAQRAFMSDTLASRTAAWASRTRRWDASRVRLTLRQPELLPPVLPAGAIIGDVRSPQLHELGVIAGDAVVVAGGHDHPVGGWGVTQLMPDAVLDSMGTAEVIVVQTPFGVPVRQHEVDLAPGIGDTSSATVLRVEELARNVAWASQNPDVGAAIRRLLEGSVAPGAALRSRTFFPGTRGGGQPRYGADAPRTPLERASAVLGALAEKGREAVEAVQEVTGTSGEVRLAGGWARSPGWVAIKSLVNGRLTSPILEPEVTAVAAALLAARARGWNPDPGRAFGGFAADMWG